MALNENARKWVEALRSGKYEQGQGYLHPSPGRFCCLGVACEVAIEAGVPVVRDVDENFDEEDRIVERAVYDGHTSDIPPAVREWLGLSHPLGTPSHGPALSSLNDRGTSFAEIADLIESEPKGLFA